LDKICKWNEKKKEYNSGGKRVSTFIANTLALQIKRVKRKKKWCR
jgi:hypothetical protein